MVPSAVVWFVGLALVSMRRLSLMRFCVWCGLPCLCRFLVVRPRCPRRLGRQRRNSTPKGAAMLFRQGAVVNRTGFLSLPRLSKLGRILRVWPYSAPATMYVGGSPCNARARFVTPALVLGERRFRGALALYGGAGVAKSCGRCAFARCAAPGDSLAPLAVRQCC